jgi:predicted ATP-grasp superfamily ATP-dependent carboligase
MSFYGMGVSLSDVSIIETISVKKKNYTALIGFAGAGFIGNTALMYAVRSKNYKQVGYVKSVQVPPMMLFVEGEPYPSFRIYIDDEGERLYVITENLISAEGSWPITYKLIDWFQSKGVKDIIAIEGLPFGNLPANVKVVGYSTEKEKLNSIGIQPLREGAVSGLYASMMEECIHRKLPWTILFIQTMKLTNIDYGAAGDAIEALNNIFKLGVDPKPLWESEEAIKKAMEQQQRQQQKKSGLFRR